MDLRVESIDAIWIGLHRVGHLVISIRHTRSRRERRPGRSHYLGPLPWGGLMASTPSAYPQVVLRTFASFRVVKPSVSAAQPVLCAWFDSRQLHREDAGQGRKLWPVFFSHLHISLSCRKVQDVAPARKVVQRQERNRLTPAICDQWLRFHHSRGSRVDGMS